MRSWYFIFSLRKSSRTSDRSWIVWRTTQCLIWGSMYWSQDYSCQQRWKPQFILGQITLKIWLGAGTPISRSSRLCSTSRRDSSWNTNSRFWMFPRSRRHFLPWRDPRWYTTKWSSGRKQKVHVCSDSGKMYEHTEANAKWKDQLQDFQQSNSYRELFGIDGEPIEFEWNIFPGHTTSEILQKTQEVQDRNIEPEIL